MNTAVVPFARHDVPLGTAPHSNKVIGSSFLTNKIFENRETLLCFLFSFFLYSLFSYFIFLVVLETESRALVHAKQALCFGATSLAPVFFFLAAAGGACGGFVLI